ncbi:RHS repeat-associated core domain-containing protein [Flavobacterium branchiophilum]|uniref:RHS repeat-associated core domain-containing protein n=1 Tax=Flavobacterium branchiophilum TaxID=55197 RepID=UPI0021AB7291|nr:RHS repeat-associated core domain-containing protein [Flavobacterium branchiophilum]
MAASNIFLVKLPLRGLGGFGSSNYITNFVGEVSQHSEYFAFGETFIEEHKNSHNSPYKFNGKELDEETGLYYYSARYYDPKLSLMISVDQLMEKFAGRSPYEYCFSNPINLTDPTGMGPEDPPGKAHVFGTDGTSYGQVRNTGTANDVYIVDPKNVSKTKDGTYVFKKLEQLKDGKGNAVSIDTFKALAGTIYAEASVGAASKDEMLGIFNCIENRAVADGDSILGEMQKPGQVVGYAHRGRIGTESGSNAKIKTQNAFAATIQGLTTNTDITNGAYYWDGTDYSKTARYTQGTTFTSASHNIYNLAENPKAGSNAFGSWSSKFETTSTSGQTVFSRLTIDWRNSQHSKKQANWYGSIKK